MLEKKFYIIEIRGTALKNAYHIVGDSIKKDAYHNHRVASK
ncbi:hypothetical protein HPHPP16_1132 [Helicobacter pylori Hp P-16]|nr:hypothetical protein HPHPP16_1132 [Helicobacter pylori Hp P-16]